MVMSYFLNPLLRRPGGLYHVLVSAFLILIFVVVFRLLSISQATYLFGNKDSLFTENFFFGQNNDRNVQNPVILITGGAGFIGFHLAKHLSQRGDQEIICIDNFNDYYEPRLKIDRAYELHKSGVTVYNEDVCNEDFLEEIFSKNNITTVVHLAAQAGVRYSLKNPVAYIRANVQCQLALLNAIVRQQHEIHLVYASSSSVYGKDSDIPFHLSAPTDRPGNMYAATKKTDELLSLQYCQEYGLKSIGLRFFTVYGEWGRPDMSVYTFAEAIMKGEEIPMFFVSNEKPLGRDFTHVSDVVKGIEAAIAYCAHRCGERFNLGRGQPVSVPEMIDLLQQELGMRGVVKKLPLPPTEILQTWADISTSIKLLNFQPATDLRVGLRAFVEWYKPYSESREAEKHSDTEAPSVHWFKKLQKQRLERQEITHVLSETKAKDRTLAIYVRERQFINGAKNYTYVVHFDVMSIDPGHDIGTLRHLRGNVEALQQICNRLDECVAFSRQTGTLKRRLLPSSKWITLPNEVLHVKLIDQPCSSKRHSCHRDAVCIGVNSMDYKCSCKDGYTGNGFHCEAIYEKVATLSANTVYSSVYNHPVLNLTQLKKDGKWLKFKGYRSDVGDYMTVRGNQSHADMFRICTQDPLCIGFSTRGALKQQIDSKNNWKSVKKRESLYVLDADYCLLPDVTCPDLAHCQRDSKHLYQCVCPSGLKLQHGACLPTLHSLLG